MKGKKQRKKKTKNQSQHDSLEEGWANIDPERIRFQHSKIRPFFSGCGRNVEETLNSIRRGELKPTDLPPIQVIVGPDENDGLGPWYFTLNNRRAWVLKRCREDGILQNNLIKVRIRDAKSSNERERYSLKNCAVDAKFIREQEPSASRSVSKKSSGGRKMPLKPKSRETTALKSGFELGVVEESALLGHSSSEEERPCRNRFYFGDDASNSSEDSECEK